MNLSEWSDVRVNCEIEKIINKGVKIQFITENGACNIRAWNEGLQVERPLPDYCNDDALAFRLMVDNEIEFAYMGCGYFRAKFNAGGRTASSGENPNRAIAECLILMNQGGDK